MNSPIPRGLVLKDRFNTPSGFTLIELMVSVAILLVIVGGGLASYIGFNERQQLATAAHELQTYLRGAQSRARAGDVPEGCTPLDGYNVKLAAGFSAVRTYAICGGSYIPQTSNNLPGEVTAVTQVDIDFNVLHGGVSGAQTITLAKGGTTYSFVVTAGGEISQGGFDE